MNEERYDVIIVGAGPAGLTLARYLDKIKLRTLLIEKGTFKVHHPKRYGTFTSIAKKHDLLPYVYKYYDTWAYYGPSVKVAKSLKKYLCVVNFEKLKRESKFKNVKTLANTYIVAAERVDQSIRLRDSKKRRYVGTVVVDATGGTQVISHLLKYPIAKTKGMSYEYELGDCSLRTTTELAFFLNFDVSNSGGWYYPFSSTSAQFGWADFYPESRADCADLARRTLKAMREKEPMRDWFKQSKIQYSYGRFGPVNDLKKSAENNFISIGDAGGTGTPLTLEGFRECVESGYYASQAIVAAFESSDFSKNQLNLYSRMFYEEYGKYYRWHIIARHVYTRWFRNEEIDEWFRNFAKLSTKDYFKTIEGRVTPWLLFKTLSARLTRNILLNMLNNSLPAALRFRPKITPSKRELLDEKL